MYNGLQKYLWQMAGYDSFIMGYCGVLYNKAAGIGIYYILKFIVVFVSAVALYYDFLSGYYVIGWLLGGLITYGFSKYTRFTNKVLHYYRNWLAVVVQFIISALIAGIIATSFCIVLFKTEIIYHLYQKSGKLNIGTIEQLWLKPYGLYLSWLSDDASVIIMVLCLAIFVMLLFLFFMPFVLIFQTRKSLYYIIKNEYEQNFT